MSSIPPDPKTAEVAPRLLVLAPQPFLEDRGTPIALRQVLRALGELGVESDVVTYPVGRDTELPGTRIFRAANPFGIRSVPVGLSVRKLVLDVTLWRRAKRLMRERDYTAIQASEEAAFLAVRLARRGSTAPLPVIYDMQSSLPEQLAERTVFRFPPVRWLLDRCEAWLLSRVDLVVTSVGLAGHAGAMAGKARIREWWYHAESDRHVEPAEVESLRRGLEIPDGSPVVLYTGTFAPYQGLRSLVQAVPRVLDRVPNAIFVLVGSTEDLAEAFPDVDVPAGAIRLVSRRVRRDMSRYYALADVVVSPRSSGRNLPLKVFDYLGAAKAIVATDIPAHRAVLDEGLAVLVTPDAAALAGGICRVLQDAGLRSTLAVNAERFAREELGWPRFVESVGDVYRPILWKDPEAVEES